MAKYKLIGEKKMYANFMNENIQLGNIYSVDENEFQLLDNIGSYASLNLNDDKHSVKSKPQDMFSTATTFKQVDTNVSAVTPALRTEVSIEFSKKASSFFALKDTVTHTLKINTVKNAYLAYLKKHSLLFARKEVVIINMMVEAQSGIVLLSEEKGTNVLLSASNDSPLTPKALLAEGNIDIKTDKSKVFQIIQPNIFQPFFNALWWRPNKEEWDEL
jgi:hypothetical protein